jgi:hypothetical protein
VKPGRTNKNYKIGAESSGQTPSRAKDFRLWIL